ncbi:MAG TPA: hypothetical protein VKB21_09600, partial [Candidatus Acidoferrum sp.]|nr:hypothetical protein [Candidatus Acidoferrum sp.]
MSSRVVAESLLLVGVAAILPIAIANVRAQEPSTHETIVLRGAKIYPVSGSPIERGILVTANGKIVAVSEEGRVDVPAGAKVVDVSGKVLMPGIIDSHSHVGISPSPLVSESADDNEMTAPVQPGLRALDAIDP